MLIVLFGVLGLFYVLVLPFAVGAVASSDGRQYFGSDEVNRQLRVYLLLGGALFAGIWAWVGNAVAASWRRGFCMSIGVLLGTMAAVTALRIAASAMEPVNSEGLVGFVLVLALTSCAGAYAAAAVFDRSTGQSRGSSA